jgi:hypothetical protein
MALHCSVTIHTSGGPQSLWRDGKFKITSSAGPSEAWRLITFNYEAIIYSLGTVICTHWNNWTLVENVSCIPSSHSQLLEYSTMAQRLTLASY